jgi:hypothetical protein
VTINADKITIKCKNLNDLSLSKINKIMKKYNTCIISGIINSSEIKVPMKKLKTYIEKNNDLPAIGENPKKARGFLMKFVSRIRSTKPPGVTTVVKRDIYNPLHKSDRWGFHNVFIKLAKVRNILMEKPIDFALGKVEKNKMWTAARIHHFPTGAGFMFPHKDTIAPTIVKGFSKYYQVLITLSEKGKDFKTGGGTVTYKNKLVEYEDYTKPGDILVYDSRTVHGVNTIDPDKPFIQRSGRGRYSGLVTLYKLVS